MLFKDQRLFHMANVCFHMINSNRVGSHVVFVWIRCMENVQLLFHNDFLSESK